MNCPEKIRLIRNTFGGDILPVTQVPPPLTVKKIHKIGYIGTISSWFDFDAINYCLDRIENMEMHLIGPIEKRIVKDIHERMYFYGPVEHQDLYNYYKDFDCLITF